MSSNFSALMVSTRETLSNFALTEPTSTSHVSDSTSSYPAPDHFQLIAIVAHPDIETFELLDRR